MPGFAPGICAQELYELDHDAVGVLATEHFDPAASQTHACGRAVGEVTGGGKSGIDAVTIAGLEADASDARLGKISAALRRQLWLPPLDQVETGRAAVVRQRKKGGTAITIVGKAEKPDPNRLVRKSVSAPKCRRNPKFL